MTDLNALIGNSQPETVATSDDMSTHEAISGILDTLVKLASAIDTMSNNLNSIDKVVFTLSNRVETAEKHLAYLLTKDPEMGPKMTAIADQLKAQESAKAEVQ